jgi:ABC-type branched-subunit amino acid transport system substrate-binding protein
MVALLLPAVAASCGEDRPAAAEKPPYQVAFVSEAGTGTAARRAIDLALAEINADSAGLFHYTLSAVDVGSDPAGATQECQRLGQVEGLGAIIGSQSARALAACTAAVGGAALPYVSISETAGEVCADNLYHIAPLPNQRSAAEETAREFSGVVTVSDYFSSVQLPANDRFIAGLAGLDSAASSAPEAARAYDAVHLLAAAVRAAGTDERAAVLAALPAASVDGPRGPISFPAGGHFATLNMFIGRAGEDGRVEPVSFRPNVAPKPACA